ncbi:TolB family protein [Nocardioides speluncae]|uniref:TolB family protein n=1 Tax=Nocardioides speluncae TaxID=2670337 RepID=UPI000D69C93B|nr:PD40 domain-containing protein [Nocardioides speluncae]
MSRTRLVVGALLIAALLGTAVGYGVWRRTSTAAEIRGFSLDRTGAVTLVSNTGSRVEQRSDAGKLLGRGPVCQRAHLRGGTLVCVRAGGLPFSAELTAYRNGLAKPEIRLDLWGNPSRAQVSPDGRFVAWTVFRTGDSYAKTGQFSTTAGFYDLDSDLHVGSLEDFDVVLDGKPYDAVDRNFWGITFADDDTFYATMGTAGTNWLIRGSVSERTLTTIREHVECPSLSPDGTRIAYKYRVGDRWRPHVLTLSSGEDVALAEPGNVDDQIAWADNATIAYAKPHEGKPAVYILPADGTGAPELLGPGASPSFP